MVIEGVPVRLYDTAGFRQAAEQIESEGIRRSDQVIDGAALTLYLIDGQAGALPEDLSHLERFRQQGTDLLVVWNKIDVASQAAPEMVAGWSVCPISAATVAGVETLLARVGGIIRPGQTAEGADVLIDSQRQFDLICQAIAALDQFDQGLADRLGLDAIAVDLQDAIRALGEITGEVTSDDLLEVMFSGFCVGK